MRSNYPAQRIVARTESGEKEITVTHQWGLSAIWCQCGWSLHADGPGARESVERAYRAHECVPREETVSLQEI